MHTGEPGPGFSGSGFDFAQSDAQRTAQSATERRAFGMETVNADRKCAGVGYGIDTKACNLFPYGFYFRN